MRHRCALGEIYARTPQYTYNALTKPAQRFSNYKMILKRGAYRILVGRLEEMRPLGRPKRRWEDNIKMDLQEVGWGHGLD